MPVLSVGFASNIDGEDLGSIPRIIQDVADGLGHSGRGKTLITQFRNRLQALRAHVDDHVDDKVVLYMTPAGVTTGSGSLVHEVLRAAGLENFQTQPGWRPLPLERLAYERPDLVAASFFDTRTNHPNGWSPSNHPVAQAQLKEANVVPLDGAWTACGGWFILDAIEALTKGAVQ